MKMGGRIKLRLDELGWQQRDLIERLPDLDLKTLSAMIARDSAKSEWADRIAVVLGVRLPWLLRGEKPKLMSAQEQHPPGMGASNVGQLAIRAVVPLVSWDWADAMDGVNSVSPPGSTEDWAPALLSNPGPRAFALRVLGDSMAALAGDSFAEGSIIIVDPDVAATPGRYVVAKDAETGRAVFRRLVVDGGRSFLRPLNSAYPTYQIDLRATPIIGVVVEAQFSRPV